MINTIDINELIKGLIKQIKELSINNCWEYYINHAKTYCRKPTIQRYEKNFRQVNDFFIDNNIKLINEINQNVIDKFINYKRINSCKPQTINQYIQIFHFAITYCIKQELLNYDPLKDFKKLKEDKYNGKSLTNDEINKIFKFIKTLNLNSIKINRNVTALLLMFDTGLRINEVCNIKINDIDFKNNIINLSFTKAHENRIIPISNEIKKSLVNLITRLNTKNYIFFSKNQNEPLKQIQLQRFIREIKMATNVNFTNRTIRTTFATNLIKNNVNIATIMKLMGHSNMKTTQRYFDLQTQEIQKVHSKYTIINNLESL